MKSLKKKSSPQKKKAASAPESARQRVYNHIHDLVSTGELSGGQILSEVQISRTLGVSRSPVREAIGQLVADGILQQAPNRSAVVVELTREDIVDLYEVREALELYAVHKVAQNGLHPTNHEELKASLGGVEKMLRKLKASGKRALDPAQMAEFSTLDMKLHSLLVLSTQNIRMQRIVADTRLLVRVFAIRRGGHEVSILEKIHRQHSAIVQAVAKGKGEEAAKILSEHIQTSLKERLDDFDLWRRTNALREHPANLDKLSRAKR